MTSIDESGLSRWSRLKKARKERASKVQTEAETGEPGGRGRTAPTTIPVEVSGDYRPWLPPLTEDTTDALAEITTDDDQEIAEDFELSTEESVIAEKLNLPEIDTLEKESDFKPFLSDDVPERLRRLALRKLWASNPLFGFRDGLNDYDEDFTVVSDYVHNMVAMKKFTDPDAPEEEQATEGSEVDGASKADAHQDDADHSENSEGADDQIDTDHDGEASVDDDESEDDDENSDLG